jgi:AraC-like DNA-binding protein
MPVVSRREGVVFERSARVLSDGLLSVSQAIAQDGVMTRTIVTGTFWVCPTIVHEEGTTEIGASGTWRMLPRAAIFLIPPRSVIRLRLTDVQARCVGLAGSVALPRALAGQPRAGPLDGAPPESLDDLSRLLSHATPIDSDAGVPALARRARSRLHDVLESPSPVTDVARGLRVAPETLSRAFRKAYGVSPKTYVHGARVFDAVLALFSGRTIADSAFAAGFADLARFYAQFRRFTKNTPGEYRASRNAKTDRRA